MIYSPLRYPGGKAKLAPFMEFMLNKLNIDGTYIEPFGGGAGIALDLLFNNRVNRIVINDYDKAIASFWKFVVNDNKRFINRIENLPVTMEEWLHQREVLLSETKCSFDLAVATFYLNRTNRSGILLAGPVGGKEQSGDWHLDARFNKETLIKRLKAIGDRKNDILIYNKDATSFISNYLCKYEDNCFVYFDPPYYVKGKQLYMNYFSHEDHQRIKDAISENVHCKWIVTYDMVDEIKRMYSEYPVRQYDLTYSASGRRNASELMIFSERTLIPSKVELRESKMDFNVRGI